MCIHIPYIHMYMYIHISTHLPLLGLVLRPEQADQRLDAALFERARGRVLRAELHEHLRVPRTVPLPSTLSYPFRVPVSTLPSTLQL